MINSHKPKDVDQLQLFFGDPYPIADGIMIYQPTIGDIMECGEHDVYSTINIFIGNSTMYRLQLWDAGQDWNKISNYELFLVLLENIDPKISKLIFGNLDFSKFHILPVTTKDGEKELILFHEEHEIIINEEIYTDISFYLKNMFGIFPKDEWAKGKTAKEAIIEEERIEYNKRCSKPHQSFLFPLISSCLNHPGFKYGKKDLKEVGIFEFMDSVQRLQTYESTTALLKGIYSGFVDTSTINKEDFNFMRDLGKTNS